ncbi:MAG TPA: hypothetical protein VEX68_27030 [Bryobacteraceae bacterium]|nr:hypothetical protein [Bryobacteraceae bacterium]
MDENQIASELKAGIEEAQSLAREQVGAAWQLHLDRVREQLESGWRDSLDRIFAERFADVESRLKEAFEGVTANRLRTCRSEVTEALNQTARRLRSSESKEEWIRTLLEAASPFCAKSAMFSVTSKGLSMGGHPEVPLASAPAFGSAVESKDTVVAVGTPRELSQTISSLLGDASTKKIYLFPVVVRQNAVAVLYAEPGDGVPVDVSALELLTSIAAASIEATETVVVKSPSADLIRISGTAPASPAPTWTDLAKPEQERHLRAQRFARNRVAEMLLHRVRQVRNGRESNNLYGALKEEIEAGREAFRREFIESCPSMVDYFHLELQRTLAKGNSRALGSDYPGPQPVGTSAGTP